MPTGSAWPSQEELQTRFGVKRVVDLHCHCLPGLDDGAQNIGESLALCRRLAEEGITDVTATPHQLGRYDGRNLPGIVREAVGGLNAALSAAAIPLTVHAGADVRIDERMPALLQDDKILSVADGHRYVLLELPHEMFINPSFVIQKLVARGVTPIVTHPERHAYLYKQPDVVSTWVRMGAVLQITAGSLVGKFGPGAERLGWEWISRGTAGIVATDAHNLTDRAPRFQAALALAAKRLPHAVVRRAFFENPQRVLEGQAMRASSAVFAGGRL